MKLDLRGIALFVAMGSAAGCSSTTNTGNSACSEGMSQRCFGPDDCSGEQSCTEEGTWGECVCEGAGGAGTGGRSGSGGTGGSDGGTSSGGQTQGGASGSATGGATTGGEATSGGTTSGGEGGGPVGGTEQGGAPAGGAPTSGAPAGGTSTGGEAPGGAPPGGAPAGGAPTGGAPTGGAPTGGAPTGGTPGFCEAFTPAAGVDPADGYHCVDFDDGTLGSLTAVATGNGTVESVTSPAASLPRSGQFTVPAVATFAENAEAFLGWEPAGGGTIQSVRVGAKINPTNVGGVRPPWTGGGSVSLMCIDFGSGESCLRYTYSNDVFGVGTTYTGLYVRNLYYPSAATITLCEVDGALAAGIWNEVQFATHASGAVELMIGGAVVTSGCTNGHQPAASGTVEVGLSTNHVTTYAYTAHYDDIWIEVERD